MEDREDGWHCVALASVAPTFSPIAIGRREWHLLMPLAQWGVTIRVDGPGKIRVSISGGVGFRLDRGQVVDAAPLFAAPGVRRLVQRIGDALTGGLDVQRVRANDGSLVQTSLPVMPVLEHVVARMQCDGYGGALLFPGGTCQGLLSEGKYRTQAQQVPHALRAFHEASTMCERAQDLESLRKGIAQWQAAITQIIRSADAVAMMSRVDGCVVLDERFAVTSFGTKVLVGIEGVKDSPMLPVKHPLRDEPAGDAEVRALGTRNQSAFGFCRVVPGSAAIIVSQDGDVRIAASDARSVSFLDGLEAKSIALPSW
jgi:hypothetical protein